MAIVLRNGNTKHLPPSVEGGGPRSGFPETSIAQFWGFAMAVEGEYRNKLNCVGTGVLDCPPQHKSYFLLKRGTPSGSFLASSLRGRSLLLGNLLCVAVEFAMGLLFGWKS